MTAEQALTEAPARSHRRSRRSSPTKGEHRKQEARPDLVRSLSAISKAFRALTGLKLAEIGLANGQDQLLSVLDETTPSRVSLIAEELNVRPSTVSKMVDRLTEKGLVVREEDAGDSRCTVLHLTAEGLRKRQEVHDVWEMLERTIGSEEDHEMVEALQRLESVITKRLARLR